jgi:hypothetical protein
MFMVISVCHAFASNERLSGRVPSPVPQSPTWVQFADICLSCSTLRKVRNYGSPEREIFIRFSVFFYHAVLSAGKRLGLQVTTAQAGLNRQAYVLGFQTGNSRTLDMT